MADLSDREILDLIQRVHGQTFGVRPIVMRRDDAGRNGFLVDGMVWIGPTAGGRWEVRVKLPHRGAFRELPCLRQAAANPQERDSLWEAVVVSVMHVAHLQAHVHLDDVCDQHGHATLTNRTGQERRAAGAGAPPSN